MKNIMLSICFLATKIFFINIVIISLLSKLKLKDRKTNQIGQISPTIKNYPPQLKINLIGL